MKKPTVAVLGLSETEVLGLSAQLEGICSFCIIDSLSLADKSGCYSAFTTDAASLILNLDFFLAHRSNTGIWINNIPGSVNQTVFTIISSKESAAGIQEKIAGLLPARNADDKGMLSQRETQVLQLVASGKTNKEIAEILFISINTVITHRKNISSKLGIRTASGLALYALMNGLI